MRKSGLKSTEVMPINPLLSDSSVGKGRIVKWQAPKKSEQAHLNDFDYSSPQPCLWFWKGWEYGEICLSTDAKPSGQAGNGRARRGERERETGVEQSWKWMQMEARAAMGGPGAWRRVYLKKICSKSTGSLTLTRYKWIGLKYWTTRYNYTDLLWQFLKRVFSLFPVS